MRQTTDLSTLIAGMVSEVAYGVFTGVTAARRLYYRRLLLAGLIIAGILFATVIGFRHYLDDISKPSVRSTLPTPAPTRDSTEDQRPKPPPSGRDETEEFLRMLRPNQM